MTYRRFSGLVIVGILLLVTVAPTWAREQAKPQTPKPDKTAAHVKQAVVLVDSILGVARGLKLPENRLRLQLSAANLLWEQDPTRAKAAMRAASDGLIAATNDLNAEDYDDYNRLQSLAGLRSTAIFEIAQRDPGTALDLLHGTRILAEKLYGATYLQNESGLELSLAVQLAATDPQRTFDIASKSLDDSTTDSLPGVIYSLYQVNPELGAKLATRFVDKMLSQRLLQSQTLGYTLTNFLNYAESSLNATEAQADAPEGGSARPPMVTLEQMRQLVSKMLDELGSLDDSRLSDGTNTAAIPLGSLLSSRPDFVEKWAPDRARDVAPILKQLNDALGSAGYRFNPSEESDSTAQPSVDSLLDVANEAPTESREYSFQMAANQALQEGDVDRARQIASSSLSGVNRTAFLDNIDRTLAYQAISNGNVSAARDAVSSMRNPAERTGMLIQLGTQMIDTDPRVAAQILAEADNGLGARAKDMNAFYLKLQLVQAMLKVNPTRAFSIQEECIDQLNGLLESAAGLEGFGYDRTYVDGELLLRSEGSLGALLEQSAENLTGLATLDFDRARLMASRYGRPEAQALAGLKVAGVVLLGQKGSSGVSDSFGE